MSRGNGDRHAGQPSDPRRVGALRQCSRCSTTARTSHRPTRSTAAGYRTNASLGLPGYPGGTDIVGNHVNGQFQLDVFGEALLLFAAAAQHDRLDADGVAGRRTQPPRPSSSVGRSSTPGSGRSTPADGPTPGSSASPGFGRSPARLPLPAAPPTRWTALAEARPGRDRCASRRTAEAAGSEHLTISGSMPRCSCHRSAARCRPTIRGRCATLAASPTSSADDEHLYRFAHDDAPLAQAEGAFLLCGFWMCMALLHQGDVTAAMRWFERNRAACGPPGLFARGVRRRPAPVAREFAPGIRPRRDVGVRRPPLRCRGAHRQSRRLTVSGLRTHRAGIDRIDPRRGGARARSGHGRHVESGRGCGSPLRGRVPAARPLGCNGGTSPNAGTIRSVYPARLRGVPRR